MTSNPARVPVVLFVALGLVFSGLAQAASPKKRTHNQNRVGPYGAAFVGQSNFKNDQSNNEQTLEDILSFNEIPFQNLTSTTDEKDIGYQATFGYRFHRFFSAEIGLVQYGEMVSRANAELDFPDDDPTGFIPAQVSLGYKVGGVLFSGIAVLPIEDKIELYARVGYLFANSQREFISKVEGQQELSGSAKGDSQDLVLGLGVGWNINQVYAIRAEYQQVNTGSSSTGSEDMDFMSIGLIVRF